MPSLAARIGGSARKRLIWIGFSLCLACFAGAALSAGEARAKSAPDWVKRGGMAKAYPRDQFLLGFAQARGKDDALESAKQQATADLARQISVQIESSVVDITRETKGEVENDLTSRIRATSDIRLDGVRFKTYRKRKDVYALAILERLPAAASRRIARDRALSLTERCLDQAAEQERQQLARQALATYRSCRTPLHEALEHEAVAVALQRGRLLGDPAADAFARHITQIDTRTRALPHEDALSIRAAAEGLAVQLARAGIGRGQRLEVAPFLYQSRDISSPFGREIALALESAIGRSAPSARPRFEQTRGELQSAQPSLPASSTVALHGSYHEGDQGFMLRVNAKERESGRLLGSGEIRIDQSGIPEYLEVRPANFESFARAADKLVGGEIVSGDLRVEIRTDKGTNGLVYEAGEELSLAVRVNQPAWIRLIYVLTNGDHVPIEQSWYIDPSKVNQLLEYPTAFEVVAPFGAEMIHAMAYTEKPSPLVTRRTQIEGQAYDVIQDGADQVVKLRGLARKAKKQIAEQTLQVTTLRAACRPASDALSPDQPECEGIQAPE